MKAVLAALSSPVGRGARVSAGGALAVWALIRLRGWKRVAATVLGLEWWLTGIADVCLLGPLFGHSARGRDLRKH